MKYYNKSIEESLKYLKTNADIGLKDEEVKIEGECNDKSFNFRR